jgi:hypothetical protein
MIWLVRQASPTRSRGRWDWLRELVTHPRVTASSVAVGDAICRLGLPPAQIVEGVAFVLDLPPARVEEADPEAVARVDGRRLATLLPALALHEHRAVRELADRWLHAPATAYQIPPAILEAWLAGDGPCVGALASRLRHEGLALLPPRALQRLADRAVRPAVRAAAAEWLERLTGTEERGPLTGSRS